VLTSLQRDELGRVLMAECVRSVRHRYPDTAPDDLPGPVDQRRVWSYTYRPVPVDQIRQAWVVSCCECLRYQSCETPDYTATLGHAVMEAIREDAIQAMIEDAPWGVTDARLGRPPALA